MYSREMGGVRSDGQLFGMDLQKEIPTVAQAPAEPEQPASAPASEKESAETGLLQSLKIDDLLLPAIALLLLAGDKKNDDLLILLVALLLLH